jgi:hypothetical protein
MKCLRGSVEDRAMGFMTLALTEGMRKQKLNINLNVKVAVATFFVGLFLFFIFSLWAMSLFVELFSISSMFSATVHKSEPFLV